MTPAKEERLATPLISQGEWLARTISTNDTNTEYFERYQMVRNFYIKGIIDGRKTNLSGGPCRKDGGMLLILTQRNKGAIERCASIESFADGDELKTIIYDKDGNVVFENVTKR